MKLGEVKDKTNTYIYTKTIEMKTALIAIAVMAFTTVYAQNLPKKSAKTEIEQMIGLTEIEIEYSRPNVNSRTIFGDLVPYGKVWRLGANQATTIELDFPININGQELDTGKYAIFAIPQKNYWTIVFNTDAEQWGSNGYDESKNVLEYVAPVTACEHTESFTITFDNVNEYGAVISISWATTEVNIPITTDTKEAVEISISGAIEKGEDLQKVYYNAADYALDIEDTERAEEMIQKSLAIERSYYNVFLLAQMRKEDNVKEAKKLGEEAVELAKKAEKQGWADYIQRNVNEW